MARGRPPKPTKLKILIGNPGKRPLPEGEPGHKVEAPRRPAWIVGRAKAEWERIVPLLLEQGLLAKAHMMALAAYCQASAELEETTRVLTRDGNMIAVPVLNRAGEPVMEENEKGKKVCVTIMKIHPAVKLQREAYSRVKAFLSEFGLSPSTQTRVKGVGGENKNDDSFEEFLSGSQKKKSG